MTKRVLVIAPTPFFSDRGTPIRIFEEVRALRKQGVECVIATYPIGDMPSAFAEDAGVRIVRVTNIAPWYTKRSAGASFTKIAFNLALALQVRTLVTTEPFDLIHAHNHEGIFIAWLAKQLTRSFPTVIADLHGSLSEEVWSGLALVERMLEKFPAAIVTSSQQNTQRVQEARDSLTVTTIHDAGIDINASSAPSVIQAAAELRLQQQIPDNAFVVTYAGGYGREKGTDTLIDVFSQLIIADERIHCILVGSVPIHVEMAIREKITPNRLLQFHSIPTIPYEALPVLLAATDCAIDPKPETSHQASGKILNAIAGGRCIVAFDREYNRELLTPEQIVDPALGADGFVRAILQFVQDDTLKTQTEKHNHASAATHTWDIVAQKFLSLYSSVQS